MNPNSEIPNPKCILVLAAGGSSRFGSSKQLAELEGRTLIRRAVETALSTSADIVCVVLGANAETIRSLIDDLPILIVVNENWSDGIGSSLVAGLETVTELKPDLGSVAITLADQPFVASDSIEQLFNAVNGERIVAASYDGTVGVPAVFPRKYFAELLGLSPEAGAKSLIIKHLADVVRISFPEAAIDIDTPDDFGRLSFVTFP